MNGKIDLSLYLQLFRGREDYFAQQGEDWYRPVPKVFDEFYLHRHLDGDATFGLYLLNSKSYCHLICIDIDIPKSELGQVNLAKPGEKYSYLKKQLMAVLNTLSGPLAVPSESILLEDTGGRGYHIWVFFSEPVQGNIAVKFGEVIKIHLDFEIEFFPKQGSLTPKRKYGNLIKLPLGLHRKYGFKSSFFCLASDGLQSFSGIVESLEHLRTLVPLNQDVVDRCITVFAEEISNHEETPLRMVRQNQERPLFNGDIDIFMRQCTAMRNLRDKAEGGRRLSHSEAFYFTDVMLSVPNGMDIVHKLIHLSLSNDYDQKLTQNEIERILPLYPPSCLTLVKKGVCSGYCKESVRKRNEDPLVSGTTPCSVWLQRIPSKPLIDIENLVERIGTVENLKRAYFQLRQYHEYEDTLFFDPFDFEQFERNLDANCHVIAKALLEKSEILFSGYMIVSHPKKINEAQQLEYREMSYTSIYDQAPIQAVFNVVAPFVENDFQTSSYGYRWNTDLNYPNSIFEDWREAYPRFRSDIMTALERYPNGFHICCDIKGFYDHINHSILYEQLRKLVPDSYVFQKIESSIRAYSFKENEKCGLPTGPAYARLLANLYLNDFDKFMNQVSIAYFRYVDDFVLIFESEEAAILGLEHVGHRLAKLGLELSPDEAKKAVIEPNTDISRVLKTLDKIHYGILAGTRHVDHLAPEAIADFMTAVERHSVSPLTIEELIKINDALPSLLYVVTQESQYSHQLKSSIIHIIEFLIKRGWFYPKKLKTIFYRILDLEMDENHLLEFFQLLMPTHKVYFLLSVFGCWQSRGDYQRLLERLVVDGLRENNVYVYGFAIAIAAKLDMDIYSIIDRVALMKSLSTPDGFFAILKWLSTIDYLDQSADERAIIRDLVSPNPPELPKILLLANVKQFPSTYVDSVYMDGLLMSSGFLMLPIASNLLVTATDRGVFFDSLLKFVLSRLAFKSVVIAFMSKNIFEKRATGSLTEIENLKALYEYIPDNELKRCMLGAVSRIMEYGLVCEQDFWKDHKELNRYNECFLFEMLDEHASYDYVEIIPERRLLDSIPIDLDSFKAIVDDFGVKKILPNSNFTFNSGKKEIRLEFITHNRYQVLDPKNFSLSPESVLNACVIVAEIYRKACYFRRFTGIAPYISSENLLIDTVTGSVIFRTIGQSLCPLYVFDGTKVGDEEFDIARMLASLLGTLIFESQSDLTEFIQENTHYGIYAFLSLFIKNMKAKDPRYRYSSYRFVYLVDQLRKTCKSDLPGNWLEVIYLHERLKASLFRYNSGTVTWNGIGRTLDEHISTHIRAVFSTEKLRNFPFHFHGLFLSGGKHHLHKVSRNLIELALSRKDFENIEKYNAAYLDLVESLLLFSTICLEIIALVRTLGSHQTLLNLSSSQLLTKDRVQVKAGCYKLDVDLGDLAALIIRQPKKKADDITVGLTLRQLSLQALFASGIEIEDIITVKKPETMREEVFDIFAHACLFRIPSVEVAIEDQMRQIFLALQSNEDFSRLNQMQELRNDFNILIKDIRKVRSGLRFSRHYGRADGKYFPPDVRCRSLFHRSRRVKDYSLPSCALTNTFPSSRKGYICSWDLSGLTVTNLMIPSEGLNSLIQDLKSGKIPGFKLSYLYSGRIMIIWDGIISIVSAILFMICEIIKGAPTSSNSVKGMCSIVALFSGYILIGIVSKIILYDLGHWIPWHRQIIEFFRHKFSGKNSCE